MPIFISYSSKDQKSAEAICTAIENRGFPCWISSRDIGPGENFQAQIVHAIREAKIMVLVFSANANNSEEIKKELVLAGQSRLVVIPVRVEDVAPDDAFAYEFATRQWIDVFGDWEHAIQRVIHQIEGVIGEAPKPSAVAGVAPEKPAEQPTAPAAAPPPQAAPPQAAPAAKRGPGMAVLLSAAAAIIVILGAVLAWQLWPKGGNAPASVATATVPPPAAEKPAAPEAPITIPPAPQPSATPPVPPASPPPTASEAAPTPASPPEPATAPPPAPATQPAPALQPAPSAPVASEQPKIFRDCPNCPEMVVIPAGSFQMGAAPGENRRYQVPAAESGADEPQHRVTFTKPFALAKFDVTHGEFAAFAHSTGFAPHTGCQRVVGNNWVPQPRASWEDPGYPPADNDPVVCMNTLEISVYLRWLRNTTGKDYRLPSEAEWEYAERAGTVTAFYWGDDPKDACTYENVGDESLAQKYGIREPVPCNDGFPDIAPVGSFKPNAFGLYDMAGNIFVLTADCWNQNYDGAPADGSAWTTGDCSRHVLRKAAYGNSHPWMFRAANRAPIGDIVKRNRVGFRVALNLE